jgi:hypothetical protein
MPPPPTRSINFNLAIKAGSQDFGTGKAGGGLRGMDAEQKPTGRYSRRPPAGLPVTKS